jgi:hypothetical protein
LQSLREFHSTAKPEDAHGTLDSHPHHILIARPLLSLQSGNYCTTRDVANADSIAIVNNYPLMGNSNLSTTHGVESAPFAKTVVRSTTPHAPRIEMCEWAKGDPGE